MSATGRGAQRSKCDFYATPLSTIHECLDHFEHDYGLFANGDHVILDPCAGGDAERSMPYPEVIKARWPHVKMVTLDIRPESPAEHHGDYLKLSDEMLFHACGRPPDIIFSNPPFTLAVEFVDRSLRLVRIGGLVIFLTRLNFLGAQKRQQWWQSNMPLVIYVHSVRPGFNGSRATDATEYAHFVWRRGPANAHSRLHVI